MNCADIRTKLQPFLEDLLSEEEYKAFCGHMGACDKCKAYVRSVGSLSNQLWKLGLINVPSDLGSTIMYKLAHPGQEVEPSKSALSKKRIVAGSVLILSAAVLFFAAGHLKNQRHPKGMERAPFVKTGVISEKEPPSDAEAQALFDGLVKIEGTSGQPEEEAADATETKEENAVGAKEPATQQVLPGATEEAAVVAATTLLHLHLQSTEDKKDKLLDTFSNLDIGLDYQKHNILIFGGSGEKVEHLIEKILSIGEDAFSMSDFTPMAQTYLDDNFRVSIYLEQKKTGPLHWHIGPIAPDRESYVLTIIKEFNGIVDYESDGIVIIFVPSTELDKLRKRIQAMRIPFSEYGSVESQKESLISGLEAISIYFVR